MKKYLLLFLMLTIACVLKDNDYSDEIQIIFNEVYSNSTFIQGFDIEITYIEG